MKGLPIRPIVTALAIGAVGGAIAHWIGLPLAWLPGRYAVCRLDPLSSVPEWASGPGFVSVSATTDELSVIVDQERVPRTRETIWLRRNWMTQSCCHAFRCLQSVHKGYSHQLLFREREQLLHPSATQKSSWVHVGSLSSHLTSENTEGDKSITG